MFSLTPLYLGFCYIFNQRVFLFCSLWWGLLCLYIYTGSFEAGGLDVNRVPAVMVVPAAAEDGDEGATALSSPNSNSGGSSFQMDICLYNYKNSGGGNSYKRDHSEGEAERASSRASDDDDTNGSTRKKLRLSKEQSAFLEESFKEHNTLNPVSPKNTQYFFLSVFFYQIPI